MVYRAGENLGFGPGAALLRLGALPLAILFQALRLDFGGVVLGG